VTGDSDPLMSELGQQLDELASHLALRIALPAWTPVGANDAP
jgi:hypothetical protein